MKHTWRTAMELIYNNTDDIIIWRTTHRPYILNGEPYGMQIEVAHNVTKDAWVKITPGTGSEMNIITEIEARALMERGTKLRAEHNKIERVWYDLDDGNKKYVWKNYEKGNSCC